MPECSSVAPESSGILLKRFRIFTSTITVHLYNFKLKVYNYHLKFQGFCRNGLEFNPAWFWNIFFEQEAVQQV